MSMPGFTAEASLYKTGGYYHIAGTLNQGEAAIQPAQQFIDWGTPIYFPPDFCPPGLRPVLVRTGGQWVCTNWKDGFCVNPGTPTEKCYPGYCAEWGISPIEYRWECQLLTL
jgi:hypothetical protein